MVPHVPRTKQITRRKEMATGASRNQGRPEEAGDATHADGETRAGREARRRPRREGRLEPSPRLARLLEPWWTREPSLLATELDALERYGLSVHQEVRGSRLVLIASRGQRHYEITYPHDFPGSGVIVSDGPLGDPDTRIERGYSFPPSGARAIDRLEHDPPRAYDRALPTFTVLVPFRDLLSRGAPAGGEITVGCSGGSSTLALLGVTGVDTASDGGSRAADLRSAFPRVRPGWWVRGPVPDWSDGVDSLADRIERRLARSRHASAGRMRRDLRSGLGALVYPDAANLTLDWLFLTRGAGGGPRFGFPEWHHAADLAARAPFGRELGAKSVAIVGCGALGWGTAMSLARSGVGRFVLFDSDKVHAGNLPRLASALDQVGMRKVNALEREIRAVGHPVVVEGHVAEVGFDLGAQALIDAKVDLIVDATAELRSPIETNLAAVATGKPALYVWASFGVVAARIFRVRPGVTPCYACVRSAAVTPILGTRRTDRWSEEFTWNGANFNLETVAAAATRMAVRTLLGHDADATNPDHVVLDIGGPVPTASAVVVPRDPECGVCG